MSATTTAADATRRELTVNSSHQQHPERRDTAKMLATLDLIEAQPELARFQIGARNRWIDGAHNRSTIQGLTPGETFEVATPARRTLPGEGWSDSFAGLQVLLGDERW